ncbi:MAG: rhomboid family intramembrane serine protease [Opitutales bacterium]
MKIPSSRPGPSAVAWLLIVLVGLFLLNALVSALFHTRFTGEQPLVEWLALSGQDFRSGKIWTLLTYSLLHQGIFHLLLNGLFIYGMGRSLQGDFGEVKFLYLFFSGVFVGGLTYLLIHFGDGNPALGASGGVMALITIYCVQRWNQQVRLMFFEINIRVQWILYAFLAIDGFGFLFSEMRGMGGTAHSAHLGGALGGWLFYRYLLDKDLSVSLPKTRKRSPQWLKKKKVVEETTRNFTVNRTDKAGLQKEVDRILDKINEQGFGSLTEEEQRVLDKARDILSR